MDHQFFKGALLKNGCSVAKKISLECCCGKVRRDFQEFDG